MDDPGWGDAWRGLPFVFTPRFFLRRAQANGEVPILILRRVYVSFAVFPILMGVLSVFITSDPRPGSDSEVPDLVFVVGTIAIAVASYLFVTTRAEKQLAAAARVDLLPGTYRSAFFLAMAFANTTPLISFVISFNAHEALFFALGVAGSVPLFARFAPTTAHLRQIDEDARTNGATTSLRGALFARPES